MERLMLFDAIPVNKKDAERLVFDHYVDASGGKPRFRGHR
jgi:hypothetical protein